MSKILPILLACLLLNTLNPIMIAAIIMVTAISLSIITSMLMMTSWFSYILMMLFISGMMVIFVYMSSIAANETVKLNIWALLMATTAGVVLTTPAVVAIKSAQMFNLTNSIKFTQTPLTETFIHKIMYSTFNITSVILMMYLFMALVATIKIAATLTAPLRSNL